MKGFSLTNIKYMVQFAREYPDFAISQQVVGQIPWGHNRVSIPGLGRKELQGASGCMTLVKSQYKLSVKKALAKWGAVQERYSPFLRPPQSGC